MKLQSNWVFVIALIFLFFSAALIITNHQGAALRFIIYSFWSFVVGVSLYLFELKK